VSNPSAHLHAAERTEHDGIVLRNLQRDKARLELMRVVMDHLMLLLMFRIKQLQFCHQLTAVADSHTERVLTRIISVDGLFCLGIEEETSSPTFSGTQNIGITETAAEDNEIDVIERLT